MLAQRGTRGRREEGPREAFWRLCSLSWVPAKKWRLTPITLPHANVVTTSESLLWFSPDSPCLLRLPWLWRVIKRSSPHLSHISSKCFKIVKKTKQVEDRLRLQVVFGLLPFPRTLVAAYLLNDFPVRRCWTGRTVVHSVETQTYWVVRLCYLRRIVYVLWVVHLVSSWYLSDGCCSASEKPQALKHPLSNRSRTSPGSCNYDVWRVAKLPNTLLHFMTLSLISLRSQSSAFC